MTCPFFSPTERADDIAFPHPARLPLGAAWRGRCEASACNSITPGITELESCNLGYAKTCPRLPKERPCDAVRFAVVNDSGTRIALQFVMETNHLPAGHGSLEYDQREKSWTAHHPEARIQKMAECFLQSYLERRIPV